LTYFQIPASYSSLIPNANLELQPKEDQPVIHNEDAPHPSALCLDQFLKLRAIVETGGQAKLMIQDGQVKVNGEVETRRRRKLAAADVVEVDGKEWPVKDSTSST
jgi:ribosome-associated protein